MSGSLFGWSAQRWLMVVGVFSGFLIGQAVPWWLAVPVAGAHCIIVLAYADACELEAEARCKAAKETDA